MIPLNISKSRHYRLTKSRRRHSPKASASATFLFYLFLDFQNAKAQVGDIEERFPRMVKKFGLRKAQRWVWSQALRSLAPIIWAWGRNIVMKPVIGVIAWAVAKGFVCHDSWLTSVIEVWKRIRV